MPKLTLHLPFPPSLNHYWEHVSLRTKTGKRYIGKTLGARAKAFRLETLVAARREFGSPPRLSGRLSISILANPPNERVVDIDNLPKCLLDALVAAGVVKDDALFDELYIRRGRVVKGGGVRVTIEPFKDVL